MTHPGVFSDFHLLKKEWKKKEITLLGLGSIWLTLTFYYVDPMKVVSHHWKTVKIKMSLPGVSVC